MPTVPAQTESIHYFRAVVACVVSFLGTALVLFSIPAITPNFLWTTLAAIASLLVIVPAILAVRRARRNTSPEPTIDHKQTARKVGMIHLVFGLLVVATAWYFPHSGRTDLTVHAICVLFALYLATLGLLLRFVPFYVAAVAVFIAATVPVHIYGAALGSAIAGLITGLLLWTTAFLVFSRSSQ